MWRLQKIILRLPSLVTTGVATRRRRPRWTPSSSSLPPGSINLSSSGSSSSSLLLRREFSLHLSNRSPAGSLKTLDQQNKLLYFRNKAQRHYLSRSSSTATTAGAGTRGVKRTDNRNSKSNKKNQQQQQQQQQMSSKDRAMVIARTLMANLKAVEHEAAKLPPRAPVWAVAADAAVSLPTGYRDNADLSSLLNSSAHGDDNDKARQDIFRKTKQIVKDLESRIRDGTLQPHDRDNRSVSVLLEKVFQLYTESVSSLSDNNRSVFDECQHLLQLMQGGWNITMTQRHVDYAVQVAAHEQRWKEASDTYWKHIDEALFPSVVSVSNPVGLYAIARTAEEEGVSVAERVFDAVLRMSMVSPQDQDKYVLAGGTAVGYAGEWKQLAEYMKTSFFADSFGKTLVAATMQACLLCHKYDEALDIFDAAVENDSVATEWQWGGQRDSLHPLCRDLAMRAMGSSMRTGMSDRAVQLLEDAQSNDDTAISVEAIHGVVSALAMDGQWDTAVELFFTLMESSEILSLLVRGEELDVSRDQPLSDKDREILLNEFHELLLGPVMRAANAEHEFGVSLLCLHITAARTRGAETLVQLKTDDLSSPVCRLLQSSPHADDLLASTMTALSGVGSYQKSLALFETVAKEEGFSSSRELYDWLSAEILRRKRNSDGHGWDMVLLQMRQLISACAAIQKQPDLLSSDDSYLISFVAASLIRGAINSDQPEMGVRVGKWVESSLAGLSENGFPSLFEESRTGVPLTDSYLSSTIAALNATGKLELAYQLVETQVLGGPDGARNDWILSHEETVKLLASEGDADFLSHFHAALAVRRNPSIFSIAAVGLAEKGDWAGVADTYRLALTSGCNSEEISLLAMKSAVSERRPNLLPILRGIIDEIAKLVGVSQTKWLHSKYHHFKRLLGPVISHRLMWWEDPKTAHLDELEYALEVCELKMAKGILPNNFSLRIIVSEAAKFEEGYVPSDRTGLPRVPTTVEGWIDVLYRVLRLAEETGLPYNPYFVRDVCFAFERLGCDEACVQYAVDAISDRGVHIPQAALAATLKASKRISISSPAVHDLEMMLKERTSQVRGSTGL